MSWSRLAAWRWRGLSLMAVTLLLIGCPQPTLEPPPDAGAAAPDAGTIGATDAGGFDAGALDAGDLAAGGDGGAEPSTDGGAGAPLCGGERCGSGEYCFEGRTCLLSVPGTTYFVAVDGDDAAPGTFARPFATWQKAVSVSRPGDITYIRGGLYRPSQHIRRGSYNTGVVGMLIDPKEGFGASGTAQAPIRYFAYPPDFRAGEFPIIDGSLLAPNADGWNAGIALQQVEHIHLKGLTVRNIRQRPPAPSAAKVYSEAYGVGSFSSANLRFENMTVHDIDGRGFQHWSGAWNAFDGPNAPFSSDDTRWINCDAYELFDRYALTPGNAADGWKVVSYFGNRLTWEGCRAWAYSDDGFDPSGSSYRTFKNCWAMSTAKYQGMSTTWSAEGNGFKLTGMTRPLTPGYDPQEVYVRIENSIAADCIGSGFLNNILVDYVEQWPNNAVFRNNLAFRNAIGFFEGGANLGGTRTSRFWNNIAYRSTAKMGTFDPVYEVAVYRPSVYEESHNTWRATQEADGWPGWVYSPMYTVTDDDFESLDTSQLVAPRRPDGSLPAITFGHLRAGSDLVDRGRDVGLPFNGSAPDLGPFERP